MPLPPSEDQSHVTFREEVDLRSPDVESRGFTAGPSVPQPVKGLHPSSQVPGPSCQSCVGNACLGPLSCVWSAPEPITRASRGHHPVPPPLLELQQSGCSTFYLQVWAASAPTPVLSPASTTDTWVGSQIPGLGPASTSDTWAVDSNAPQRPSLCPCSSGPGQSVRPAFEKLLSRQVGSQPCSRGCCSRHSGTAWQPADTTCGLHGPQLPHRVCNGQQPMGQEQDEGVHAARGSARCPRPPRGEAAKGPSPGQAMTSLTSQ